MTSLVKLARPSRSCHPERSEESAVSWQPRRGQHCRRFLSMILLAILLVSPGPVSACSHLWHSYTVKGDFVIEVSSGVTLLEGAEVLAFRKLDPPYVLKTVESQMSSEQGLVSIHGLAPGEYRILARHAGITGEEANVTVVPGSPSEQVRIKLSWPLKRILQTEQVLGTLSAGRDQSPLFGAILSLARVFPDRPAVNVKTNMEGQYAFPSVPEGLYVLHVSEREDASAASGIDGNIFVEVKHGSLENHMPALLLMRTSCGLGYQPTKEKTY